MFAQGIRDGTLPFSLIVSVLEPAFTVRGSTSVNNEEHYRGSEVVKSVSTYRPCFKWGICFAFYMQNILVWA